MPVENPRPMHPGKVLQSAYLDELGLSHAGLAAKMGTTEAWVDDFVAGDSDVTPEVASQLARALGTTQELWETMGKAFAAVHGRGYRAS